MNIDFIKNADGSGRELRDVQRQTLAWISDNWSSRVLCLNLPVGCHAKGQEILMFDGSIKRVEDVVSGDLLMGPDSTPRTVGQLYRGRQMMYTVTPTKGAPFVVNQDHILSLQVTPGMKDRRYPDLSILNISVNDYLKLPTGIAKNLKLYRRGVQFQSKPQTIPPYIVGLWLADGNADGPAITKTPGPLTKTWVEWGQSLGYGHRIAQKPNNKAVTVFLSNGKTGQPNRIWSMFRQLGLENNKHVPYNYLTGSTQQRLELLAGILDGDGSASCGGIDFISKYQDLAESVTYLCRSVGLAAYMKKCQKSIKSANFVGEYWRVTISGDCSVLPFKRLKIAPRLANKDVRRVGFTVKPYDIDDYYGFAVDVDNLYMLGDFTVTHNSGKSLLAKSVADAVGAHVITPSNVLIDQYTDTYPAHNFLKGKHHYTCKSGISCHDWTNLCEQSPCDGCPYTTNRDRALSESTFFNPMSLYYLTQDRRWREPRTLIVDEAHTMVGMLLMMSGFSIPYSVHKFPKNCTNEIVLLGWLDDQVQRLKRQMSIFSRDKKRMAELGAELANFRTVHEGIKENAQNYAIWTSRGSYRKRPEIFLNVKPLTPPRQLTSRLLSARNLILMSGTLFPSDIRDLLGDTPYKLLDLPSPIDKSRRSIRYTPTAFPMNIRTKPSDIVSAIEAVLDRHPGENAIIHVTYSMSEQLCKLFKRPILYNDRTNKEATIKTFKEKGGIFLAAGCAEGVDLKGDLCRVNIIPKLPYPNLGDPVVAKRKALEDGQEWYDLATFKTLIQQAGRSTRSEEDYSITYVLDPNFKRKFEQWQTKLPQSFKEAVVL